jgi:hypothetical protein
MAKVFTIPVQPNPKRRRNQREPNSDRRFLEGQRVLAQAIKYLAKSDKTGNRAAIELLFEHFESNFRVSDSPLQS